MPFGPKILALPDEKFPVVVDQKRKLFDIRYPMFDDTALFQAIAAANSRGGAWSLRHSDRRAAQNVLAECQRTFPGYEFVRNALAAVPQIIDRAADPWY